MCPLCVSAAKTIIDLVSGRPAEKEMLGTATKPKRGRKKLLKTGASSPLLDSPHMVRQSVCQCSWPTVLFIVTLISWGRRCISETSVWGCDGFIWTFAVFVPDVRRSRGGEGERSPDHQETSAVQDLQKVTSSSCDYTTQVSDGIRTTQDSENKAFLFSETEEEFVLNICTVCLSVSF